MSKPTKVKLKVLEPFVDKYTSVEYKKDDIIEVNKTRGTELLKDVRHLVEEIEVKKNDNGDE